MRFIRHKLLLDIYQAGRGLRSLGRRPPECGGPNPEERGWPPGEFDKTIGSIDEVSNERLTPGIAKRVGKIGNLAGTLDHTSANPLAKAVSASS